MMSLDSFGPQGAWWLGAGAGVLAFLLGSIPFGYLMGKSQGLDLRQHGSGNIGATNVWRVMGKTWGTAAFVLDFIKGVLPLLLLGWLVPEDGSAAMGWIRVVTGLASILGHNYTPWLGFKGGKGIATSAGVLLMLVPWAFGVVVVTWVILFFSMRYVSVASIGAAVSLPIAGFFFYRGQWAVISFSVLAGVMAVLRHKANIVRLLDGTESRFTKKTESA
jgi:glycerol-3-phosphate acyltransferase PlsY